MMRVNLSEEMPSKEELKELIALYESKEYRDLLKKFVKLQIAFLREVNEEIG